MPARPADLFLISIFMSFYQNVMAVKIAGRGDVWECGCPALSFTSAALLGTSHGQPSPARVQAEFMMTWWCCTAFSPGWLSPFNILLSLSSPALNYPINLLCQRDNWWEKPGRSYPLTRSYADFSQVSHQAVSWTLYFVSAIIVIVIITIRPGKYRIFDRVTN